MCSQSTISRLENLPDARARVGVGAEGCDTRFAVTNLQKRNARVLYEDLYCQRGQAEAPEADDEHAPVRTCHRYLGARASQLNCRQALAEGLPIDSGEIESARRHVVQQRLKRPGAWWRVEHAEHMLALRINRINGDWDAHWKALALKGHAAANDNSPSIRHTA